MEKPTEFKPPRHWIGPEELDAKYWEDAAIQEKRGQEFFEKPVEMIDQIDRIDQAGVVRREFLTIMGASMAMAGVACARRPVHKIIPYVVKPEEVTLGVANWYASTWVEGGEVAGVLVKTREGRPIKLEGNVDHPINKGALSARAQASVLALYDPDRLTAPVLRSRDGKSRQAVDWKAWDSDIVARLKRAVGKGGKIRVLTGEVVSPSTLKALRELSQALGGRVEHVVYEPLHDDDLASAQALSYGSPVIPHYRFGAAQAVVTFGADFLGAWGPSVESAREWAKNRKLEGQKASNAQQSKLFAIESVLSITGANADHRVPVRAGDEVKAALAVAHELIVAKKRSRYASDSTVVAALSGYSIDAVSAELGGQKTAHTLAEAADALWQARGHGLVVAGGPATRSATGVALQVVVNLLNSALENEGAVVDGSNWAKPTQPHTAALEKLVAEMRSGSVDVLLIAGTNPAFSAPTQMGFAEAAAQVGSVVVISDREDETAQLADAVGPESHWLEAWGDAHPRKGVWSLVQPTISPLHATRSLGETLVSLARGVSGGTVPEWYDYVRGTWRETAHQAAGGDFETFWEASLQKGGYFTSVSTGSSPRAFKSSSLSVVPKFAKRSWGADEFSLTAYTSVSMGDGRGANNAWLQELPDPISSVTWDNYVAIAPSTAKKLALTTDDVIEVSGQNGKFELPVLVQPGMHPQGLAAAVGYHRRNAGKVGTGTGRANLFGFASMAGGRALLSGSAVKIRKTGKRYRLATTQWHTALQDRPIINDVSLDEFRKNPAAAVHTDPHLRMDPVPTIWPKHEYSGYRWGMAIDLTSCIGCGACSIACQAENNIPVVGREQVRNARQMHWIRVDRYYTGSAENPDVVFQPMLCQHCENAPCETVCPVLATVHDDEGLNVQVYNRCVGTRYCQNNCPYKVRRFNFFDHWKAYEGTLNLAWNPDVTVRTRGIMEKCTFCVQRIRDVKDKAKTRGERVADGAIKTACQATCPTDAIVFGDINDPNSRVSKLKNSPQAFRVLEILNTKPAVSYLTKVRNKPSAHGEGSGHHA